MPAAFARFASLAARSFVQSPFFHAFSTLVEVGHTESFEIVLVTVGSTHTRKRIVLKPWSARRVKISLLPSESYQFLSVQVFEEA